MSNTETLLAMADAHAGMTPRQYAGNVLFDEIARNGMTIKKCAEVAGLDRKTLYNIRNGVDTVEDATLKRVAGAAGLPRGFLLAVVHADEEKIRTMTLDEDLRRDTLEGLAVIRKPRRRRAADG